MAKYSLRAHYELDTDPEGDNNGKGDSLFSPKNLLIVMPYLTKLVGDLLQPPRPGPDFTGHTGDPADCPQCDKEREAFDKDVATRLAGMAARDAAMKVEPPAPEPTA